MFDSFVKLSEHIHELRALKTGRPSGRGMSFSEIWSAAIDCPRNSISEIRFFDKFPLPAPMSGIFVRLDDPNDDLQKAAVYVDSDLEKHWQEFAAIKELMHCWSPGHTYVGTPEASENLVAALVAKADHFSPDVAADKSAVLAATEVILPHYTAERHISQGQSFEQIAFAHNLNVNVVKMICRHDILHARKHGSLNGD